MKVKFSKKLLSVILAALMVVTSIPIVAVSTSAATKANEHEVTGVVTVDPVIYLHGAYGGDYNSTYAYMMNGDRVADGTVTGEKSTTVQSSKTITRVTVIDTNAQLTIEDGKLTGNLGSAYSSVTTSTTDKHATIRFTFEDGTVEYHKLAVKANPVAQHAVAYAESWNGSYKRAVNFEMLAVDSYGQTVDGSVTYGDDAGGLFNSSHRYSGRYNYPSMYTPNNSGYPCGDYSIAGLTTAQLSVDKQVGYYGLHHTGRTSGNSDAYVSVTPAAALYYLDKSTDKNEGVNYSVGSNTFTIKMFLGSLYNSFVVTQPVEKSENSVSGSGFSFVNDPILDQKSAFVSNTGNTGYATITGSAKTTGDLSGVYTIGYYYDRALEGASSNGPNSAKAVINMPFTVKVVDKSNLRNVYDEYIGLNLDSNCYTADSWEAYKNALLTAEAYLNDYQVYNSSNESAFVTALQSAKSNLDPIEDNTDAIHSFKTEVVAPTCTEQGYTLHTCEHCGYSFKDTYVDASGHVFKYEPVDGEHKHIGTCTVCGYKETVATDCYDEDGNGLCDACRQSLLANWSNYVAQIEKLRAALNGSEDSEHTYRLKTEKLVELQTFFDLSKNPLPYYKLYANGQMDTVTANEQTAIDSEARYIAGLMPTEDDYIDIGPALAATMNKDPDQYDPAMFEELQENIAQEVKLGQNTYIGANYDDQDVLDTELFDALDAPMVYSVFVNDTQVPGEFEYGTVVTVDGTGKVITEGVTPTDETFAWTGCYAAPSLGTNDEDPEVDYNTSTEKYLTNDSTYTFVVKGDTYLTAIDSKADEQICMVTIKNNVTGFISDIFYVRTGDTIGTKLEENVKDIACYTFAGFFDARSGGEEVTAETVVNKDMTVYACYNLKDMLTYDVAVYGSYDAGFNGGEDVIIADEDDPYAPVQYRYNDRIDITTDDENFYAWAKIVDIDQYSVDGYYTAEIISYNRDYSFYVCEDAYLFAITKAEAETGLDSSCILLNYNGENYNSATDNAQIFAKKDLVPIYNKDGSFQKFSMIGSFAVPEGYTLLEKGFIFNLDPDTDATAEDLVVTNDNENIKRVKVIHFTCGDQFVLNVNGVASTTPVDYCAYAVVQAPDGTRTEIYSNVVTNATAE